jgi:hypothetical protein
MDFLTAYGPKPCSRPGPPGSALDDLARLHEPSGLFEVLPLCERANSLHPRSGNPRTNLCSVPQWSVRLLPANADL